MQSDLKITQHAQPYRFYLLATIEVDSQRVAGNRTERTTTIYQAMIDREWFQGVINTTHYIPPVYGTRILTGKYWFFH